MPSTAADGGEARMQTPPSRVLPPDGGWGWIITAGSFVMLLLVTIPSHSAGVLFLDFLVEDGASATLINVILCAPYVITTFFSYLFGPLEKQFGLQRVTVAASLLFGLGFIMSAFATSSLHLLLSHTLLTGLPVEILVSSALLILPRYFTRNLSIANSVANSGVAVGHIVMPPLVIELNRQYGFKGGCLVVGALVLHCCVSGMLFHPVHWHASSAAHSPNNDDTSAHHTTSQQNNSNALKNIAKTAIHNLQYLKSPPEVIMATVMALCFVGHYNFFFLIPYVMEAAGYSDEEVALCLSVSGWFSLGGRIAIGFLIRFTRLGTRTAILTSCLLTSASVTALAMVKPLLVMGALIGVCGGGYAVVSALYIIILVEHFGVDMVCPMFGVTNLIQSIFFLAFGPILGYARDITGSYQASMFILAACFMVSALLWLLLPPSTSAPSSSSCS